MNAREAAASDAVQDVFVQEQVAMGEGVVISLLVILASIPLAALLTSAVLLVAVLAWNRLAFR